MKRTNEVSKLVGVSKRTLQYYDEEGMLVVKRTENNHRLYDQKALERIWQIMIYKEMGFDLKEIKQLLSISEDVQKEHFRLRMEAVKSQISKLKDQMEVISLILTYGIPLAPEESSGITYVDSIVELRRKIKEEKEGQE